MRTREELLATPPPQTFVAPASFPARYARVYNRVLDALDEWGVRALVGGATALNVHTGIWRFTKDLDLFIDERDLPRARQACEAAGFDWMVIYRSWLAKALHGEVFVDFIHRGANGLFAVENDWFERAHGGTILGRDVEVISPEDLILGKAFVGNRNRFDGADVLHVIYRAHERIDWDRLARMGADHADLLLAYVHLYRWAYPAFADAIPDRFVDRLHREAAVPRLAPPFRGRLLDGVSFEVDVKSFGLPDPSDLVPSG